MLKDKLNAFFQYLIPKKILTRLVGYLAQIKTPWFKNCFIRTFIKMYQVNMQEAQIENVEDYENFNTFFIRHLKSDARPIADASVICPVDGCLGQFGLIEQGQLIQAKGHQYSAAALLANDMALAEAFKHGSFATLYLAPKDYHRVHMPVDGRLVKTIYVPGALFSVSPATTRGIPNVFARNERLVCVFDTPVGLMASVMVGATIVGSMATSWGGVTPRSNAIKITDYQDNDNNVPFLEKGSEMGYFQMGSTVILLFANAHAAAWANNLTAGQSVRLGQVLAQSSE